MLDTPASNLSDSTEPDSMLGRLELANRSSSRDLDPATTTVPFKERIRPGMVISWNQHPGRGLALSMPDGLKLAVVLCPVEAVQGTFKDVFGNVINPTESAHTDAKDSGTDSGARYLCAPVTPAIMAEAYELNLWQQVVIDVGLMDKEMFLEYDSGTRYYYVSV
jgi:kinesin family protein 2/24